MLVVSSVDDEFFMPDDDRVWWNELLGDKQRLFLQNAEHTTATKIVEVIDDIIVFTKSILNKSQRPQLKWTIDRDKGEINVTEISQHATTAYLWYANTLSTMRKDFRLLVAKNKDGSCPSHCVKIKDNCIQVTIWKKLTLKRSSNNTWIAKVKIPKQGWVG